MIKSTLKSARYCPLVIQSFSNFLGLFQGIMANPEMPFVLGVCWTLEVEYPVWPMVFWTHSRRRGPMRIFKQEQHLCQTWRKYPSSNWQCLIFKLRNLFSRFEIISADYIVTTNEDVYLLEFNTGRFWSTTRQLKDRWATHSLGCLFRGSLGSRT